MHGTGGFPIDLVLFAMIAVFLALRLRGILGTRTGFEGAPPRVAPPPRAMGQVIDLHPETVPQSKHKLPEPDSQNGRALQAMHAIDQRFDPDHFLTGAEAAFRMIVAAFTEGSREKLRPLLTDLTFRAFDQAIALRNTANQTAHTEIKDMIDIGIQEARLAGNIAAITVRFVSHQINYTVDAQRAVVTGTDAITEITDVWRFERDLSASELAWRLAAATA